MAAHAPHVALFTDSYHDVSGVARTCRNFEDYALRRQLPFLTVRAGSRTSLSDHGSTRALELRRGPLSIPLDTGLWFDPCAMRHAGRAESVVRAFGAELVHVTSPGDVGILGVRTARRMRIPLVASWHTNVHEFAARRLAKWTAFLPAAPRRRLAAAAERACLSALIRFYRMADLLLAPNRDLIRLLTERTGRPVYAMDRGVRTDIFSPRFRRRNDEVFVLGYAGRLRPEKNLRMLVEVERALLAAGEVNYRFLLVGDGSEMAYLKRNLIRAEFTGFLQGEALATAFAGMDLFVFPSETDTYGNVILEAMASGVPALVTSHGGPRALVQPGRTGFVATDAAGFCEAIRTLMHNPGLHSEMRQAAQLQACRMSWDRVFDDVYQAYGRLRTGRSADPEWERHGNGGSRDQSNAFLLG
ncbi:MAG: glycosyltransferase [Acidobacteria bacterium]|nr:glycosyltransferase [Acidobacteriota bacterium]